MWELFSALLRRGRLILGWAVVCMAAAVLIHIVRPSFVSEARIVPQRSQGMPSQFAGLAAQFGLNVAAGDEGQSPEFYAQLLKSQELIARAVQTMYVVPSDDEGRDTIRGSLIEIYKINKGRPDERLRRAVDQLRRNIAVSTDPKAGIVTVRVSARSRALSEAINRRLLRLVNEFNLQKRQTQAAAERVFVEGRLADAKAQLDAAESAQEQFLGRNRDYRGSPQLQFQASRLERQVSLRQQVYSSLVESYERARINEVRNTPVITVVDAPEGSGRRAGNGIVAAVLGLLVGAVIGLAIALALETVERARREGSEEFRQFEALTEREGGIGWLLGGSRRRRVAGDG